jgi:hypothetical protein
MMVHKSAAKTKTLGQMSRAISVILHRMWIDVSDVRFSNSAAKAAWQTGCDPEICLGRMMS